MKKMIIPAIIAKNQDELDDRLSKVIDYVNTVQLDFMDNDFVPNSSLFFDFQVPYAKVEYEAHLMVSKPENWIEKHIEKVDTILVHYESQYDIKNIIQTVKEKEKRIGFVLNPKTSINQISHILDDIDQVLIMTVNPGFYGSPFLPETMEKISDLRKLKTSLDIEVDGGITDKTIQEAYHAGANLFVSGSYIVKSENVEKSIKTLEKLIS
ncbi:MAG: ribulose-phosphate 3-epimerase [Thermoplasmata archaeon]|nr:MAG: ribulose-phosphate 3-epimerase [Thermoplasmata archaeon]